MVNGKSLEVVHHLPGGWVLLGATVIGNITVYEAAAKLSSDGTEVHDVITAKTMVKLSTGQRAIAMDITARNEKPTSEICLATQPVPHGKMKLVRVTNAVILPNCPLPPEAIVNAAMAMWESQVSKCPSPPAPRLLRERPPVPVVEPAASDGETKAVAKARKIAAKEAKTAAKEAKTAAKEAKATTKAAAAENATAKAPKVAAAKAAKTAAPKQKLDDTVEKMLENPTVASIRRLSGPQLSQAFTAKNMGPRPSTMSESRAELSKALKVKSQRSTPEVQSVDDDSGSESEDGAAVGAAADEPPAWATGMMAQMAHFQAELFKLQTKSTGRRPKKSRSAKRNTKMENRRKSRKAPPGAFFTSTAAAA